MKRTQTPCAAALRLSGSLITAVFAALVSIGSAQADTVKCADPMVGNQDRQYQTTGAIDCVWGTVNIGQGNAANDGFLTGTGTNDALYGNAFTQGSLFSRTWTTIDSQDYNEGGNSFPAISGLTISNLDNNSFNWQLTDTSYTSYALGLKDGGDPQWGVFLLSSTSGLADILTAGSWSHVVLYGSNDGGGDDDGGDDDAVIPEPGTVALVGLALLGVAVSRRRRAAGR